MHLKRKYLFDGQVAGPVDAASESAVAPVRLDERKMLQPDEAHVSPCGRVSPFSFEKH